jgi:type IV pilus assembly protein PilA
VDSTKLPGSNGVPRSTSSKYVASVNVVNGIITVTPNAIEGIKASDTYVLTPSYTAGQPVQWINNGGCINSSLCK